MKLKYLNGSLLTETKVLHTDLSMDVYKEFRKLTFDFNITPQAAFEEFCKLCVSKDEGALRVLNKAAAAVLRGEIEKHYSRKKQSSKPIDTIDHDTLYHLIEKGTLEE